VKRGQEPNESGHEDEKPHGDAMPDNTSMPKEATKTTGEPTNYKADKAKQRAINRFGNLAHACVGVIGSLMDAVATEHRQYQTARQSEQANPQSCLPRRHARSLVKFA
jgi:hypothetical protein